MLTNYVNFRHAGIFLQNFAKNVLFSLPNWTIFALFIRKNLTIPLQKFEENVLKLLCFLKWYGRGSNV